MSVDKRLSWVARAGLVALALTGPGTAMAQNGPHAHHRQAMHRAGDATGQAVSVAIGKRWLVTQDGEQVDLSRDVIGNRIVVVDFVYTTCTTVCPVLSAVLREVQRELGERLGDEVAIVSISVDPLRDTPPRLSDYAGKLGAGNGWVWLTGEKRAVDAALRDFGAYTPNFEDHPSMVLVGDGASGEWSRFLGFPGANHILDKINELEAARSAQSALRE